MYLLYTKKKKLYQDFGGKYFIFPFLYSWLKEWKLRADREERKKQKDKKQEEGSNGGRLDRNTDLVFSSYSCLTVHDWMMAFCVQTLTGTVEKRTHRMARTHCVIHCSLQGPLEWEKLLRYMPVLRSWALRYKYTNCILKQCVGMDSLIITNNHLISEGI